MPSVMRVLDANANRAREALRVMEEAARFVRGDEGLAREIKAIRHALAGAMEGVPASAGMTDISDTIFWRDTPGDVGVGIKTEREGARGSVAEVAVAAGKRLSEALRALEEYGKVVDAGFARAVEALRYRGYEAERRLAAALATGMPRQWRLCVLLSEALCPAPKHDWLQVAQAAIDGGADCVQLREKSLDAGELLARAKRLVAVAAGRASVIINDRPDVALLSGADGVHVGQHDLPAAEVRKLVGRQLLVGVSTSRLAEAERAFAEGADYCGVGPMFATTTKHKDVIVGPAYLREYVAWGKLPHLAIGGVTPERAAELAAAGARGVAVSSAVCAAADPAAACRGILSALEAGPGAGASGVGSHPR